jgi:hypothetical protein
VDLGRHLLKDGAGVVPDEGGVKVEEDGVAFFGG